MKQRAAKGAGPVVQFDNEVTRCIRQHARSHMRTEVCGVLIGENQDGVVQVRASIEALNAAQAGTHVTFTQDAWETIYKVKDESYPDQRIVGWYHSHPGFGVFLSEHDTFIHRNFFSSPDQVAWVYDPHTDEEGCFGWIESEIHRISSFSIADNNGDGLERTPKEMEPLPDAQDQRPIFDRGQSGVEPARAQSPRLRWGAAALACIAAMVLGFAISYFLFPLRIPVMIDPATGDLVPVPQQEIQRLLQRQAEGGVGKSATPPAQTPSKPAPDPNSGRSK